MVDEPLDVQGYLFEVGQKVAVATMLTNGSGGSAVAIKVVTKVANGRVYLDGSKQSLRHPDRVAIVQVQ